MSVSECEREGVCVCVRERERETDRHTYRQIGERYKERQANSNTADK